MASAGASAETVAASLLLLSHMGIAPVEPVAESTTMPTFGEVVPYGRR
ncbi:hypothetical protein [Nocardia sp.]|nr:hypothetical protein [Nocardia sp.]